MLLQQLCCHLITNHQPQSYVEPKNRKLKDMIQNQDLVLDSFFLNIFCKEKKEKKSTLFYFPTLADCVQPEERGI